MDFIAFSPVGRESPRRGYHYLFRCESFDVPGEGGRASAVSTLRLNFLQKAALIATGEACLSRAADKLAPSGATFRARRNRWLRLHQLSEFDASSRRQNGAIATCLRELGQVAHSAVLDMLSDDNAPLWRLLSEDDWTAQRLDLLAPQIANLQDASRDLWSPVLSDEIWKELISPTLVGGMPSIATAEMLWFRLRRAQIIGNPYEYARAFRKVRVASCEMSNEAWMAIYRNLGQMFPEALPCLETTDWLFLKALWNQLAIFLQAWESRIWLRAGDRHTFHPIGMGLAANLGEVVVGLIASGRVPARLRFPPIQRPAYCSRQGELDLVVNGTSIAMGDSPLRRLLE
ncbi:hypothetical protein [Paraburkholderia sp. Cpub6]|uniref:hypothetical protein n=1 Tax=Paraburkholderia sp. Cpub6 TaxID=2723094 RepID=UPI0016134EBE|nr:hypothetical protein [Paraburkholderia sp. Cpub6]MBB5462627.1 hypothetical protein [Paraburkholderia sp. Cpub6]